MSKAIQPIEPIAPTAPILPPPLSQQQTVDHRDHSTISKAPPPSGFTPSKPDLTLPITRTIHQLVNRTEPAYDKWSQHKESSIDAEINLMDTLSKEEALKLEEALAASKDVSFWGVLSDVSNSIVSAASFVFGLSVYSAGSTVAGGALVASGVLSIGNLAFKYGHVWDFLADQITSDEEMHKAITTYLPASIGVVSAAMGIYGGYGAWKYASGTKLEQTTALLETLGSIATGIANCSSGLSNAKLYSVRADLSALQSNSELSRIVFQALVDELKDFHQKQTTLSNNIGRVLDQISQSIQIINQPV